MASGLFSERYELFKPAAGLVVQAVPTSVRSAVRLVLRTFYTHRSVYNQDADELWFRLVNSLNLDPDGLEENPLRAARDADELLKKCDWRYFLDACEVMFGFFEQQNKLWDRGMKNHWTVTFLNSLNQALTRHYSAYRMTEDGKIVEPRSSIMEAAVAQARAILASPELSGPDNQFQEGLNAFYKRPEPDYLAAVSQVTAAVEGIARVVLKDDKIKLGPAIDKIMEEHKVHGSLSQSLEAMKKVHGYASDEGGRHGITSQNKNVGLFAEYVLHQSAAAIVLIARLYGHEVVAAR